MLHLLLTAYETFTLTCFLIAAGKALYDALFAGEDKRFKGAKLIYRS